MNYVRLYIDKLRSGEIIACKKIKQFYFNIIEPILDDKHPTYYFNEKKGEKFIKFAETFCKQSKGAWAGKPIKLLLFQKAKWQAFFGILHRETKLRRFTEIFDVRGRKNGKSTEHAALSLYLTLTEPGGEIYVAATVAEQARRIWEEAQSMIDQDEEVGDLLGYKVFPRPEIYTKDKTKAKSYFKVLSSKVKTFDGLNASCGIIDEIHELPRPIYDILKQSTSARDQAIISMITTAGFPRGGLFDDEYNYATDILNGDAIDDTLMPLIYELDDPSEIYIEEAWIKANPALGVIKKYEVLRSSVARSKSEPNYLPTLKVKDFNIVGVEGRTPWLEYDEFNVTLEYSAEELERIKSTDIGKYVIGGFDLSKTGDVTAFNLMIFDREKGIPINQTMYWVTKNFYDAHKNGNSKVPWAAWLERGLIRISGTTSIEYSDITKYILELHQSGWTFLGIYYDSWSATYLISELESYNFGGILFPVYQGYKSLSIPMQTLGSHLREKKVCYQNNPVTKWMLSNVEVVRDENANIKPKKAMDKRDRKIDGVATILNCYVGLCEDLNYYLT